MRCQFQFAVSGYQIGGCFCFRVESANGAKMRKPGATPQVYVAHQDEALKERDYTT